MAFLVATTSLPAVYRPNGYARTTTAGMPHARANMRPLALKLVPWEFFENLGILSKIVKNGHDQTNTDRAFCFYFILDHKRQTRVHRLVLGPMDVRLRINRDSPTEEDDCAHPALTRIYIVSDIIGQDIYQYWTIFSNMRFYAVFFWRSYLEHNCRMLNSCNNCNICNNVVDDYN